MTDLIVLAPDDVAMLTGATKRARQRAELDALGITYRVRSDGSPVVLRSTVEAVLGIPAQPKRRAPRLRLDETEKA